MEHTVHPTFQQLVDLVDLVLPRADRQTIRDHIAACEACAQSYAWAERTVGMLRAGDVASPPFAASAHVRNAFRSRGAAPIRRRVTAKRRFDSSAQTMVVGIRAGTSADRQMLFEADALAIDLRIMPESTGTVLAGQILGDDVGGTVDLIMPSGVFSADINDLSEFTLPSVASGKYTLLLHLADRDVVLPDLDV